VPARSVHRENFGLCVFPVAVNVEKTVVRFFHSLALCMFLLCDWCFFPDDREQVNDMSITIVQQWRCELHQVHAH